MDIYESARTECYNCQYKANIQGDCHIRCLNPDDTLVFNSYGVNKGWAFYPFNYDPVWKESKCKNFLAIKEI